MPNLRGRDVPKRREVPKDRDAKSDNEFDFRSAEEAEAGSAKESESEHKGSSRKKEPKPTMHREDDAIEGEKTDGELETANSDKSENRSEEAESVQMFDSDMPDQPRAKRRRRQ